MLARKWWIVAALVLAFAGGGKARAENASHAKANYKDGLLQYNLGEYEKALEKFKGAYLELPDPAFLFNIAQCQRQLGQYAAASKSYRAFLRESPGISARTREDVQRLITEMDDAVRDQRAKAPPTGMQPPHDEVNNAPPTPEVTPPPPVAPPAAAVLIAAPPPPPRPWYKHPAGMTLTFGGAGLAIVGLGLLGGASSADSDARNAMTLPDQQNSHSSAITFQGAGIALVAIGAVAAVSGAVILGLYAKRHKRAEVQQ